MERVKFRARRRLAILVLSLSLLPADLFAQSVTIGSAQGDPGHTLPISVDFQASPGVDVAALQLDIEFAAAQMTIQHNADGSPNCVINPATGKTGAFSFFPSACSDPYCLGIRAMVFGLDNDQSLQTGQLFTCSLDIELEASTGVYPLVGSNFGGASPSGDAVGLSIINGQVVVGEPGGTCP